MQPGAVDTNREEIFVARCLVGQDSGEGDQLTIGGPRPRVREPPGIRGGTRKETLPAFASGASHAPIDLYGSAESWE